MGTCMAVRARHERGRAYVSPAPRGREAAPPVHAGAPKGLAPCPVPACAAAFSSRSRLGRTYQPDHGNPRWHRTLMQPDFMKAQFGFLSMQSGSRPFEIGRSAPSGPPAGALGAATPLA